MTDQVPTLSQRVADSFSRLRTAAKDLNSISDELGKSITEIDSALKKLNLGVSVWVRIREGNGLPNQSWYWREEVGYDKTNSSWGIFLRKADGDYSYDDEREEVWRFSDGPRALRIAALDFIPELIDKLSEEAAKTTTTIRSKLNDVQLVAAALSGSERSTLPIRPSKDLKNSSAMPTIEELQVTAVAALASHGHASASQMLSTARWLWESNDVRILVPGIGKKMLALTVNATAEKIIRDELKKYPWVGSFAVMPREALASKSDVDVSAIKKEGK